MGSVDETEGAERPGMSQREYGATGVAGALIRVVGSEAYAAGSGARDDG